MAQYSATTSPYEIHTTPEAQERMMVLTVARNSIVQSVYVEHPYATVPVEQKPATTVTPSIESVSTKPNLVTKLVPGLLDRQRQEPAVHEQGLNVADVQRKVNAAYENPIVANLPNRN